MKPLKIVPASRVIVTSLTLLMMCACSSTPPQDDGTEFNGELNSELNNEEGIPEAATDEVPTDLGQPETYSYGFNEQATDQASGQTTDLVEKEKVAENIDQPVAKIVKKHKKSRQKRILSQDNTPAPAAVSETETAQEPAPVQSVVETPAPVEQPTEVPPAYEPPPVEEPVAQIPVEVPTPFYQHKFFIPGVVVALLALFFLFRKKRKY